MGDVIRATAAAEEIFKDTRTALNNARAKGGTVKERAEEGLAPILAMVDATEAELATARAVLAPLSAEVRAENDRADAAISRIYDEVWNDVGRPANDRYLALMFPGGAGYYTDGDTPGQPARMELLARLFDKNLHPKLTAEQSNAYAARVREAAVALKEDVVQMAGAGGERRAARTGPDGARARRAVRARQPQAQLQERRDERGGDPRHPPRPAGREEVHQEGRARRAGRLPLAGASGGSPTRRRTGPAQVTFPGAIEHL